MGHTISLLGHDRVTQSQHTEEAVHITIVPTNCIQQRRIIESKLRFKVVIPGEVQRWCILPIDRITSCQRLKF
jgi:hypothetical protein